jgi:hypothetical protein
VLLLPLLVATYVCWQLFGGRGRRAAHVLLVALASAGYAGGLREGLEYGRERRRRSDALVQDLREGVTPGGLATRHGEFFYPQRSILATRLEMLREAGHGPYRGSAGDPDPGRCGAWAPAALRADAAHNMEWTAGTGRVTGRDPWVIFRLPAQTSLCAVRLTVGHTTATGSPPRLRVFWGRDGGDTFEADRRHTTRLAASGEPQSVLAWIDGPVGALRLAVDSRADSVYVSRVEWLPRR